MGIIENEFFKIQSKILHKNDPVIIDYKKAVEEMLHIIDNALICDQDSVFNAINKWQKKYRVIK